MREGLVFGGTIIRRLAYSLRNTIATIIRTQTCLPGVSNWGEKQTVRNRFPYRVTSTGEEVQAGRSGYRERGLGPWLDVCQGPYGWMSARHVPQAAASAGSTTPLAKSVYSANTFFLPRFNITVSTYICPGGLPCSTLGSICTFYSSMKVMILLY